MPPTNAHACSRRCRCHNVPKRPRLASLQRVRARVHLRVYAQVLGAARHDRVGCVRHAAAAALDALGGLPACGPGLHGPDGVSEVTDSVPSRDQTKVRGMQFGGADLAMPLPPATASTTSTREQQRLLQRKRQQAQLEQELLQQQRAQREQEERAREQRRGALQLQQQQRLQRRQQERQQRLEAQEWEEQERARQEQQLLERLEWERQVASTQQLLQALRSHPAMLQARDPGAHTASGEEGGATAEPGPRRQDPGLEAATEAAVAAAAAAAAAAASRPSAPSPLSGSDFPSPPPPTAPPLAWSPMSSCPGEALGRLACHPSSTFPNPTCAPYARQGQPHGEDAPCLTRHPPTASRVLQGGMRVRAMGPGEQRDVSPDQFRATQRAALSARGTPACTAGAAVAARPHAQPSPPLAAPRARSAQPPARTPRPAARPRTSGAYAPPSSPPRRAASASGPGARERGCPLSPRAAAQLAELAGRPRWDAHQVGRVRGTHTPEGERSPPSQVVMEC